MKKLSALTATLLAAFTFSRAAQFEISLKSGLATNALNGRLLVVLSDTNSPEPRLSVADADANGAFVFGRDANNFTSAQSLVLDDSSTARLNAKLSQVPAGRYYAQTLLDVSTDFRGPDAPGNLFCEIQAVQFDPKSGDTLKLELSHVIPDHLPAETEFVKFIKIQSKLLSEFHHRPIFLRAGIILPLNFASESRRRYPLWIHIGGYGTRYTRVAEMMRHGFSEDWTARDTPRMIYVLLDGAGPNGDPYQVNSANNGPYGDAVVTELIPAIEKQFRGVGTARGRMLSGRSTGGWSSLALQIFYPDFFGGVWSSCPDGVDFRAFQLVNIYEDDNAFVNHHGEERPSARDLNGDVHLLMRREVQMENVLGHGGQWTRSGQQWGAWNAVYGPRGADGLPSPIWDADGKINHAVAEQWKKYDLRLVLESNWPSLAPKLRGKIHIAVGEADDYFLNNAVHLLDNALSARTPKDVATFAYGPGKPHGWMNLSLPELIKAIGAAAGAKP